VVGCDHGKPRNNGLHPTATIDRRTHLMRPFFSRPWAFRCCCGQISPLEARRDNTTARRSQRARLFSYLSFPATHAYFADWITFRRSETGVCFACFRVRAKDSLNFFFAPTRAAATIYNADRSLGPTTPLCGEPTLNDAMIPLARDRGSPLAQVADQERFFGTCR